MRHDNSTRTMYLSTRLFLRIRELSVKKREKTVDLVNDALYEFLLKNGYTPSQLDYKVDNTNCLEFDPNDPDYQFGDLDD